MAFEDLKDITKLDDRQYSSANPKDILHVYTVLQSIVKEQEHVSKKLILDIDRSCPNILSEKLGFLLPHTKREDKADSVVKLLPFILETLVETYVVIARDSKWLTELIYKNHKRDKEGNVVGTTLIMPTRFTDQLVDKEVINTISDRIIQCSSDEEKQDLITEVTGFYVSERNIKDVEYFIGITKE